MSYSRSDGNRAPSFAVELTAEEWAKRAQRARAEGAYELAVQCGREAIRRAPMHTGFRELFTEILYERLEAPARQSLRGPAQLHRPAQAQRPSMDPAGFDEQQPWEEPPTRTQRTNRRPAAVAPPEESPSSTRRIPVPAPRSFAAAPLFPTGEIEDDFDYGEAPSHAQPVPHAHPAAIPRHRVRTASGRAMRPLVVSILAVAILGGAVFGVHAIAGGRSNEGPALPDALRVQITDANKAVLTGSESRGVSALRAALKDFPEHSRTINASLVVALEAEASRAISRKEYATAQKLLDEATTIDPESASAWEKLGVANHELARGTKDATKKRIYLDSSERAFRRSLDRESESPKSLLGLAQVYQARNEREKAVQYFKAVLDTAPKSPEARTADSSLATLKKKT